jgi:hypothetical protein
VGSGMPLPARRAPGYTIHVRGELLPQGIGAWTLTLGCAVSLGTSLAGSEGCVDPRGDYDDFVARASAIPAPEAGPADTGIAGLPCSEVLSSGPSGTFFGACLTTASAGDATSASCGGGQNDVVPSADGTTAQLTVTQTFLDLHATNISQTVGPPLAYRPVTITPECTYVLDAGTVDIPGGANSAGVDLVLDGTRYRGKIFTDDESCSALDATITAPVTVDLTKGGNYCVFRRAPPSGAVTPFTLADFACPGAPPM